MYKVKIPIKTPNNNQKIWRYMDFSKYVDLVTTEELHFTRADKFEDPYDCSAMQFFGESSKQLSLKYPQIKERTRQVNTFGRLFVYLNCWHMNDGVSAALWKLYSENKYETIAIQTTFGKLKSEIQDKQPQEDISISTVTYGPENAGEPIDEISGGKLYTAMGWENIIYKRPSFEHEQELRAFIFQGYDKRKENDILRNKAHLEKLKERDKFIRIPIDPS